MKLKLLTILFMSILCIQLVNAAIGVGYPYPSELELKPGESGRFQFEIQTTPEEGGVTCTYSLEQQIPVQTVFDEQSIPITPTGNAIRMPVYATVTVPLETEPGIYSTSFCVSCRPRTSTGPVGALGSYCGITFGVSVVGERTRENPYVPPKKTTNTYLLIGIFGIMLLLIILIVLIVRYIMKRHD